MLSSFFLAFFSMTVLLANYADTVESDAYSSAIESNFTCAEHELEFKKDILEKIDFSIASYRQLNNCLQSESPDCKEIKNASLSALKQYRVNLLNLHKAIAIDLVKDRPSPEFAEKCLLNNEGMPEFIDNIRDIKIQVDDELAGIGEKTYFQHNLDSLAQEILSGKTSSSLAPEILEQIRTFKSSPVAKALSPTALYQANVSDQELTSELSKAHQSISDRISKLREHIASLKDYDLYKLYDFEQQFEAFKSQGSDARDSAISECRNKSKFLKVCTLSLNLSRCGSKIWGFTKDLLPLIPAIDAVSTLSHSRAAGEAGILSSSEVLEQQTERVFNFLFAIPLPSSAISKFTAKLAGAVPQRISRINLKNLAPDEKTRMLSRNSILDETSRIFEISNITGRKFSADEAAELMRAHNIGEGYFEYTAGDFREKIKILKRLKIENRDIDEILRRGLLGGHRAAEGVKIESAFTAIGLKVESKVFQKSFNESAAKKAADNIQKGFLRRMKGSNCFSVETLGEMRVILSPDKSTVLFAGSHEAYNKFYTTSHFAKICR